MHAKSISTSWSSFQWLHVDNYRNLGVSPNPNLEFLHRPWLRFAETPAGVTGGHSGSKPRLPRLTSSIKGNFWVVPFRDETRGWPPHKTPNFSLLPKHTHIDQHPTVPSPTTSPSQNLQPLPPKRGHTRPASPASPIPVPTPQPSAPSPFGQWQPPQPTGVLHPYSSASLPSRPAAPLRGTRPPHRLLQVHNNNNNAAAAAARYPGSESSFRERREETSGRKPRPLTLDFRLLRRRESIR